MPICDVCGTEKQKRPDSSGYRCKECQRKSARERYRANPLAGAKKRAVWKENNIEKVRKAHNCWGKALRKSGLTNSRAKALRLKYNMTDYQYIALLQQQDYKCAICCTALKTDKWSKHYPVVDHCHKSMVVRGILCNACNTGIGRFGDDPIWIRKAAHYLEEREGGITLPLDATQEVQSVDL
jgi:hypothetical protein